jgi:glycosyltransferase involved in cell wall biosynthesis
MPQMQAHLTDTLPRVLFIGHDGTRTGAPIVLLDILRWLKKHARLDFALLLERGGPLTDDYRAICPVWVMQSDVFCPSSFERAVKWLPKLGTRTWNYFHRKRATVLRNKIERFGPSLLYANTVATRRAVELLAPLRLPLILHGHELEMWIQLETGTADFDFLAERTARFIAASEAVSRNFVDNHGIPAERIEIVPEFTDTSRVPDGSRESRRLALCKELNIEPSESMFVGAAGTLDWRKGADLFMQVAAKVIPRAEKPTHFIWLGGDPKNTMGRNLEFDLGKLNLQGRVHFLGSRPNAIDYIDLFDVFVLTSREDPFPIVMLEAGSLQKPVVCFDQSGGAPDFVESDAGLVAPYLDVDAMAEHVRTLLADAALRTRLGDAGAAKVAAHYDVAHSGKRILEIIACMSQPSPGNAGRAKAAHTTSS